MINIKARKLSTQNVARCSLFIAMIAIGAHIKVPIPYIPFTLQFLFTNLCALLLGATLAFISIGGYIFLGLMGLPVFTTGGGISYIFTPSFGYLIGFAVGGYVAGKFIENKEYNSKNIVLAGLINLAIVYLFGAIYYYFIANFYLGDFTSIKNVLVYCIILPIPADLLLCALSLPIVKRVRRVIF